MEISGIPGAGRSRFVEFVQKLLLCHDLCSAGSPRRQGRALRRPILVTERGMIARGWAGSGSSKARGWEINESSVSRPSTPATKQLKEFSVSATVVRLLPAIKIRVGPTLSLVAKLVRKAWIGTHSDIADDQFNSKCREDFPHPFLHDFRIRLIEIIIVPCCHRRAPKYHQKLLVMMKHFFSKFELYNIPGMSTEQKIWTIKFRKRIDTYIPMLFDARNNWWPIVLFIYEPRNELKMLHKW